MSKVLIITSTNNILKYKNNFSKCGAQFDYLICENSEAYDFGEFKKQNIYVDHLMLPIDSDNVLMTNAKLQHQKNIKQELKKLENIILEKSYSHGQQMHQVNPALDCSDHVFYLEQLIDLKIGNKVYLELRDLPVFEYDHVYIEESYLALSKIEKKIKLKNVIDYDFKNVFQFTGLGFKTKNQFSLDPFWIVNDSNYKSIYDNFYFVTQKPSHDLNYFDIWSWLPIEQTSNPTYVAYMKLRLRKFLSKKFDFIEIEPLQSEHFLFQPVNTAIRFKNKFEKRITLMQSLCFKSDLQISKMINHTNEIFIKKMKIKKENKIKINPEAEL